MADRVGVVAVGCDAWFCPVLKLEKKLKIVIDEYGIMPYSAHVIKGMTPATQNQKEIDETKMKTKLTITHNGFHGYTTRSIIVDGKPGEEVELTDSQIKKLSRAACGCSDCKCGETLLKACSDWGVAYEPRMIQIPEEGTEIEINGNYPQR